MRLSTGWAAIAAVALVCGSVAIFSGCGGGGSSQLPGSDQMGTLVVHVNWPERAGEGRFIPPTTQSIKAFVFPQGNLTTVQVDAWANYPSDVVVTNVPPGPKDLRVWAYDAVGGTGNPLAYGVCQVLILGGRENSADVRLHSYRLFFDSNRDVDNEIFRATPDGRYTSQVTLNIVADFYPAASPDGKKIAYSSNVGGDYEIHVYDNTTNTDSLFADLAGNDCFPGWSPDSKTIAWTNAALGTWKLAKQNLDGSGYAELSFGATAIYHPTWSPDGTRVALHAWDGADYEIHIVWSDLSASWQVTNDSVHQSYPVWSLKHENYIYVSQTDSGGKYQLTRLYGTFLPGDSAYSSMLTSEPWHHYLWDISPDGSQLAYWASPPTIGNDEIFYYDLSSDESIRVTYNPAGDRRPCFLRPLAGNADVYVD